MWQEAECGCDQLSCTPLPVSASFRAESGSTYTRIHHLTHALEGVEKLPVPLSTLHTQETDGSSRCSLAINLFLSSLPTLYSI